MSQYSYCSSEFTHKLKGLLFRHSSDLMHWSKQVQFDNKIGQLQLIQFSHTSDNNEITKDESTINNFTLTPKKIFFSRP